MTIKELQAKRIEEGGCVLAVCNGYQVLGKNYETPAGVTEALDILDITTSRCEKTVGDIIVESNISNAEIVGFENRVVTTAGNCDAFGKVIYRDSQNCREQYEGIMYKSIIGTSIHGPLLPKNPEVADYIICTALKNKGFEAELSPIDDEFENMANKHITEKYIK